MTTSGRTPMTTSAPLLRARSLVKEFSTRDTAGLFGHRRTFRAVDDVSLDIAAGQTLALVGESGSGKSTTARLVGRLLDVTAGTVEVDGQDVTGLSGKDLHAFRSTVQFVFQDPYSSSTPGTPWSRSSPRRCATRAASRPAVPARSPGT